MDSLRLVISVHNNNMLQHGYSIRINALIKNKKINNRTCVQNYKYK